METETYPYRPRLWVSIASITFFGLCTIVLGEKALHNDRGLLFEHVIRFSPENATMVLWILTVVSAVFVLLGLWLFAGRFGSPRTITLGADRLIMPKSPIGREHVEISYRTIAEIATTKVGRQTFLTIRHSAGALQIPQNMLPSRAEFERLQRSLSGRVTAGR